MKLEKSKTVEVPVAWLEALIFHAEKIKPELKQHELHYLLGYINSAKDIIKK
jgi:hypothetical protein